jgi:hypothetical protein
MSSDHDLPLPADLKREIAEIVRSEIRAALQPAGISEFASIREALLRLSLSRTEFYRRVRGGELRLLKRGRRSFIAREEIDAFAQRLRSSARHQP